MKRLAPLLALLWWGQAPICLLAADVSHAHGSAGVAATSEHHLHADHGPGGASEPQGEGVPSEGSCAEHCASLAQALPSHAASHAAPSAASLALPFAAAARVQAAPQLWGRTQAPGPPPPEPLLRTSILRL